MKQIVLLVSFILIVHVAACQKQCDGLEVRVKGDVAFSLEYYLDEEYNFLESRKINYTKNRRISTIDSKIYYKHPEDIEYMQLPDSLVSDDDGVWEHIKHIKLNFRYEYGSNGKLHQISEFYGTALLEQIGYDYPEEGVIHQTFHKLSTDNKTYARFSLDADCKPVQYKTLDKDGNVLYEQPDDLFTHRAIEKDGLGNEIHQHLMLNSQGQEPRIQRRILTHHVLEGIPKTGSIEELANQLLTYLKANDYGSIKSKLLAHRFNYLEFFNHIGDGSEVYFETEKVEGIQQYQIAQLKEQLLKSDAGFNWKKASIKEIDKDLHDDDGLASAACDIVLTDGQRDIDLSYLTMAKFTDGWRLFFVK
ncbi:MAG: hypothetical protein AAFX87_26125 [Bacteroidota bacterium]